MKASFRRPLHVACTKYFLSHALCSDTPAKRGRKKVCSLRPFPTLLPSIWHKVGILKCKTVSYSRAKARNLG